MAITQALCSSFKEDLLGGVHDLDTDDIKIALYTSAATLDASTTAYSATNEASGTGYTAGGESLSGAAISLSGTTAFVDFTDAVWTTATITARGALIYNADKSNKAIAVLDFGADKTSSAGDFTVVFPTADASNAIVRIA
jgi:VCBS repeat-containing protein